MSNAVSEKFNLETFFKARLLALRACDLFNEKLEVGMTEKEGIHLIDEVLSDLGSERKWHPTKFRFAKDTNKSFRDKSELESGIKEGDYYFLDIGPVFNGHEADIGRSFGFKCDNPLALKAENIFKKLERIWKSEKINGASLYDRALKICEEEEVVLNPKMAGHRLGDFPHALQYKGSLESFLEYPIENLWVLEIHILNKEGSLGAFFEDILI